MATEQLDKHGVFTLLLALQLRPWMTEAACGQVGIGAGEEFFPLTGENPSTAYRVCSRCPVQTDCGEYAMDDDTRQDFGVWGAMSLRRRNRQRMLRYQDRRHAAADLEAQAA